MINKQIAVAASVVLFFGSVLFAQSMRKSVEPPDSGKILENPSMGWVFHHFDNSIDQYGPPLGADYAGEGWPGLTVAYLRLAWSYLEPREGEFDWSLVDEVARRYIRAGRKIAFRFTCFESGIPYATPRWVKDAGANGRWFKYGVGVVEGAEVKRATWEPDYDDPVFLAKLENFLKEAAGRYNGNPHVAFVDIGSIGIWGEGNPCARKYPLTMYKTHIDLHAKYFGRTLLVGMDDWRPRHEALEQPGRHARSLLIRPAAETRGRTLHIRAGIWLPGPRGRSMPNNRFLPARGLADRRVEVGAVRIDAAGGLTFKQNESFAPVERKFDFELAVKDFHLREGGRSGVLDIEWLVANRLAAGARDFCHLAVGARDIVQGCSIINTGNEALDHARQLGATMRDDSIIFKKGFAFTSERLAQDFWPELPVVLESGHYWSNDWSDGADRDYLAAIEAYHGSYISIHGPPDVIMAEHKEIIREMSLRMGYRLQLVAMSWPRVVKAGTSCAVNMVWRNAGVAPCYPGGHVALTLKNSEGKIEAVLIDKEFNLRNLEPGPVGKAPALRREVLLQIPEGLASGRYEVYVSVGSDDGTPVIALPLAGDDGARRYKLGALENSAI